MYRGSSVLKALGQIFEIYLFFAAWQASVKNFIQSLIAHNC